MEDSTKRHVFSVSLTSLVAITVLGSSFWLVAKPFISKSVADEIKEDVKQAVEQQVKTSLNPVTDAFRAQLRGQIAASRREIARLEYRKERAGRDPDVTWTEDDAIALSETKNALTAQEAALAGLR